MHPICVTCGTQFAESRGAARALPDLRGRAPVRRLGGPGVDHARRAARARHRLALKDEATACSASAPSRVRDRPAGAAGAAQTAGRQLPLGLHQPARRGDASRVVEALGGIAAIAISHPHFYASMVEWSRAFGGVPVYLHADDREWVMRPDPAIVFWEGETLELGAGPDADALRRALRGRAGAALGGRRGGPRRAADRRHHQVVHGPPLGELHVQLSELHPAAGGDRAAHAGAARALPFERIYGAWSAPWCARTPRRRCAARPSATSARSRRMIDRLRPRVAPGATVGGSSAVLASPVRYRQRGSASPGGCRGRRRAPCHRARRPRRRRAAGPQIGAQHAHRHHRRRLGRQHARARLGNSGITWRSRRATPTTRN